MSERRARPRAATLALEPRTPLRLDGEAGAFLVATGFADVFAREEGGARRPLFRVEAGEALVGLEGTGRAELIAVGAGELQRVGAATLDPRLADAWSQRLSAALGGAEPSLVGLSAWLTAAEHADAEGLAGRLRREQSRQRALFSGLVRMIAPKQADALAPPPADDDALFAAAGMVAEVMGLAPLARPVEAGSIHDFGWLVEIARASGIRVRQTVLRGAWWRQDIGPQVGWRGEARTPVAILPAGRGYVVCDPQTRARELVDERVALDLSADAACFYRPPPEGPITLRGLVAWVAEASRADVRRVVAAAAGAALLALAAPALTGVIVDQAILSADVGILGFCVAALLAAAVGVAGFLAMQSLAIQRLGFTADALMQGAAIDQVLRLPPRFFEAYSAGDLADRLFGVAGLRRVFGARVIGGLLAGVFCIFSFGLMAVLDARLAVVAAGLAVIDLTATILLARRVLRHERGYAAAHGHARGLVLQMLTGVAKLRVAAATTRALALWTGRYARQVDAFVDSRRAAARLAVFNAAYPLAATLVVFGLAAGAAETGPGRFLAFLAAFGQAIGTLGQLGGAIGELLAAAPALERIWPVLTAAPEPRPQGGAGHRITGAVELRDVSFAYTPAQRPVLDRLSLKVAAGEFVAIVGPSGGGKSTILRLLLGFERASSGGVLYDGRPIEALDMVKLRRQIGVVLQDGKLLSGSLYDNICGAVQVPEAQVWDAVRRAGLEADIAGIPMGLHTVISEGAAVLSGGQKQRLLIARALVHRPKLLLFDEATSALDNRTQAVVTAAIGELAVTRIVIAHRLSTIRDADRIVVVDGGRVVQEGDYDTLSRQPGLFAELARRQLT